MAAVELRPAFAWTCEACGRDHFARAVTFDPQWIDPAHLPGGEAGESIRAWAGSGGRGRVLAAPARVRCPDCGAEYETSVA